MNTFKPDQTQFPVDEWAMAMKDAVSTIIRIGRDLVATHRLASEKAEEVCRNWKLEERQAGERESLDALFKSGREILEKLNGVIVTRNPADMAASAKAIERNLPVVEDSFLQVRHCAQDLLHWARRYGDVEDCHLAEEYRACHARLTSFSPVFKPRLESLQLDLVIAAAGDDADPGVKRLLSAITRYNAVLDTARRFVQAVADPQLELVFAETDLFLQDIQRIPLNIRGPVASELNDCCQGRLYDPLSFDQAVRPLGLHQPEGVDSSLVVFESHGIHVLMTVDEDPIFGQLTVHLLRAVGEDAYDGACAAVTEALCNEWR